MPNPFYQIYEGAALLAGAEPHFLGNDRGERAISRISTPCRRKSGGAARCCSCARPAIPPAPLRSTTCSALALAERHDFVIASDECYGEIYLDEARPPPAAAGGARQRSRGFERCVVFHSLSKRSSVPGLRSGFVAGDRRLIKAFLLYRTYHGCALPVPDAARQHRGLERRRARRREPPPVPREVRRVLPILRAVLDVAEPDGAFTCGRTCPTTSASRASCSRAESHGPARQLPRARHAARQPGPRPRAHLARRDRRRVRRRRGTHPRFLQVALSPTSWEPLDDRLRPRRHHRRRLRAPRRAQSEERPGRGPRRRRGGDRAARHRQGARRRETGRPVARQPVAQEGRAAVLPHARQPAHRRRLHAVLRQGAAQVRATTTKRASAAKASASCRHAIVRRGAYVAPNACSCRAT